MWVTVQVARLTTSQDTGGVQQWGFLQHGWDERKGSRGNLKQRAILERVGLGRFPGEGRRVGEAHS